MPPLRSSGASLRVSSQDTCIPMLQEDFGAAKTLSYFLGEESPSAKVQLYSHARTHMHDPARSRRKVCTRALRMCAVARVRACACVRVCGCSLTCTSISSRRWRMQWMSACRSVCTPWGNLGCRGCHAKPNEHGSAWHGLAWLGMACAWCHAHSLHFQVTEDRSDGVLINTCGWVDGDGFKTQAWVALSNAMPAWCWCVCLCKFAN